MLKIKFIDPDACIEKVNYIFHDFDTMARGYFWFDKNEIAVAKQENKLIALKTLLHEFIHFSIYHIFGKFCPLHDIFDKVDRKWLGFLWEKHWN